MFRRSGFGRGALSTVLAIMVGLVLFAAMVASVVSRQSIGSGLGILSAFFILYLVGFGIGAITGLIKSVIGFGEKKAKHHTQSKSQAERDRQAQEIAERVLRGEEPLLNSETEFVLYLRPFYLTGRLHYSGVTDALFPWSDGEALDIETLVAKSVQSIGAVVALGEPGENIGFGRVKVSESDWQRVFGSLASRASIIIIIPADRPGTLWEIKWLKDNDKLETCIFLMPPKVDELDIAEQWSKATIALKPLGVRIPPFEPGGLLFIIDSKGNLVDSWPPIHRNRIDLRKLIRKQEVQAS